MSKPSFEINRFDRLIAIQLKGQWHSAIDLEYLSELGQVMQRMRQSTWAIVADFRDWYIDDEIAQLNTHYSLHLDRRNQISECWIVRNSSQAEHLDPFFKDLDFKPQRVLDQPQLKTWGKQTGIDLTPSFEDFFFPASKT